MASLQVALVVNPVIMNLYTLEKKSDLQVRGWARNFGDKTKKPLPNMVPRCHGAGFSSRRGREVTSAASFTTPDMFTLAEGPARLRPRLRLSPCLAEPTRYAHACPHL